MINAGNFCVFYQDCLSAITYLTPNSIQATEDRLMKEVLRKIPTYRVIFQDYTIFDFPPLVLNKQLWSATHINNLENALHNLIVQHTSSMNA